AARPVPYLLTRTSRTCRSREADPRGTGAHPPGRAPGGCRESVLLELGRIPATHPLRGTAGGEGAGKGDHGPADRGEHHQLADADLAIVGVTGRRLVPGHGLPPGGKQLVRGETGGDRRHRGDQLLHVHSRLLDRVPWPPYPPRRARSCRQLRSSVLHMIAGTSPPVTGTGSPGHGTVQLDRRPPR